MSNLASNHSTSLGIPQPYFISCISTPPHSPCDHSTSYHHISHLTLHDIAASHHAAHILHCTLFHITATLGWIRHNIPHLCRKCGLMWNIELWWWDVVKYWAVVVRCRMCNALSLHLAPHHIIPPHFTLHHVPLQTLIISDSTSHHTFHVPPPIIPHHWYRPFHITPVPTLFHWLCNTIFKIAPLISATLCITPQLALHPILHYAPHNATDGVFRVYHDSCDLFTTEAKASFFFFFLFNASLMTWEQIQLK